MFLSYLIAIVPMTLTVAGLVLIGVARSHEIDQRVARARIDTREVVPFQPRVRPCPPVNHAGRVA